jgi:hypothetical protein
VYSARYFCANKTKFYDLVPYINNIKLMASSLMTLLCYCIKDSKINLFNEQIVYEQ